MAFDSVNSHLYWTEISPGRILRCNPDGSNVTVLLNETEPTALTIDIQNRFVILEDLKVFKYFHCIFIKLFNYKILSWLINLNNLVNRKLMLSKMSWLVIKKIMFTISLTSTPMSPTSNSVKHIWKCLMQTGNTYCEMWKKYRPFKTFYFLWI